VASASATGLGDEKKRKESKKFLFNKKESKADKGYSTLEAANPNDSVFFVHSTGSGKNSSNKTGKSKPDTKIATLSVFKKSFKD
jgi:hypothetical protein